MKSRVEKYAWVRGNTEDIGKDYASRVAQESPFSTTSVTNNAPNLHGCPFFHTCSSGCLGVDLLTKKFKFFPNDHDAVNTAFPDGVLDSPPTHKQISELSLMLKNTVRRAVISINSRW